MRFQSDDATISHGCSLNAWTCQLRDQLLTKHAQLSNSYARRGLRLYSVHPRGIQYEDVNHAWRILRATWCHVLIEQTYSLKVQDSNIALDVSLRLLVWISSTRREIENALRALVEPIFLRMSCLRVFISQL